MAQLPALKPLPPRSVPWGQQGGYPAEGFAGFAETASALLRLLAGAGNITALNGPAGNTLTNAVDDAAAAAAGVAVGAFYRNGSVVMIRVV